MQATFYNFSKKGNSTKRPTGAGTVFDIKLKTPTSIENPVVTISHPATENLYTYVYIPGLNRYYHVVGQTSVNAAITEYSLQVDTLATYKTEILDSVFYVLRSASDPDLDQIDDTWTHNGVKKTKNGTITVGGTAFTETGFFIVETVSGKDSSYGGGTTFYRMGLNDFLNLVNELFTSSNYSFDTSNEVQTYFNPFQYVVSCRYYPLTASGGTSENISMGWFTYTGASGVAIPSGGTFTTLSFTPGGSYVNFTNRSSDWTRLYLYVPSIGHIELDSAYYGKSLYGELFTDFRTGQSTLMLYDGSKNNLILSRTGQMGIDIQLSQLYADQIALKENQFNREVAPVLSILNMGASLLGGISTGNASAFASAFSGATQTYQREQMAELEFKRLSNSPSMSLSGGNGNMYFLANNYTPYWVCTYYDPLTIPKNQLGGTLYRNKTLKDISGFTQCANVNIDLDATITEKQMIKSLLEGGFYIE